MLRVTPTMFLCLGSLAAQSAVRIDGDVADQSGARIAGASVSLRAESSNWKAATATASDGSFRFDNPPTARLELRVEQPGFQASVQTLDVTAAAINSLAVTLLTGSVRQTVEVAGAAAMLQPNSAVQTSTISTRQIENLPTGVPQLYSPGCGGSRRGGPTSGAPS